MSKKIKTRIVKVINWDERRIRLPHRYSCQKASRLLFWKYWEELNWFYGLGEARQFIDEYILKNTEAVRGVVEIIDYPEGEFKC